MATIDDEEVIFNAALDQPDGEARSSFLEEACNGDPVFRRRIEQLLSAYGEGESLISPAYRCAETESPWIHEKPGALIGAFKLLEQIGEGGMGVVFMAEQLRPVRRKVALKIIKPGMDTRQVVARFEAERQALAMMEHANIARVLDGGVSASGRPYFAMELVNGIPITEYCDRVQLPVNGRLELVVDVCRAVQHAHLKGIIHRDLKPTNVLVTECDGRALVKIIDFGIAKAVGHERLTERTLYTGLAQLIGTPAYMSPEQAALSAVDVDTRSDVYSLGVMLYELLTGTLPFDALSTAAFDEVRRVVRDVDPLRPSARISTLAVDALATLGANRQVESAFLQRQIRGELDWIVMKAIHKDRARRYQSAILLAEDIEAFLRNDPVTARPASRTYLLTKFAKRHRSLIATAVFVFCSLVVGSAFSLWQASEARVARDIADESLAKEKKALTAAASREQSLRRELYAGDVASAWKAWSDGETGRARSLLGRFVPAPGEEDLREFAWRFLNARCSYSPTTLGFHDAPLLTAALSPDGRTLASGDRGGTVIIWDIRSRKQLAQWRYSDKEVTTVAFSPDGRLLAAAGQDATIRLWSVNQRIEVARLEGHEKTVCSVSWAPDGARLASGARDNSIRIWDVASQREEKRLANQSDVVRSIVWLPDGSGVAAAVGREVHVLRGDDWNEPRIFKEQERGIISLAATPDGRYLATAGYGADVCVYDLHENMLTSRSTSLVAWSLAFSSDGRYLLAGMGSGGPCIWRFDPIDGHLDPMRLGMERGRTMRAATLTPRQDLLVTASEEDRRVRIWEADEILGGRFVEFGDDCLAVAADKEWAICAAADGGIVIRHFPTGAPLATLQGHEARAVRGVVSPSGRWLATISSDLQMCLWSLDEHRLIQRLPSGQELDSEHAKLRFSPDERMLGLFGNDGPPRIWRVPGCQVIREAVGEVGARIAFAPHDQLFATSAYRKGITLWGGVQGDKLRSFGSGLVLWDMRFSNDSARLFSASGVDGAIVWDVATGNETLRFSSHQGSVGCVAVSPDEKTLATTATDNTTRLGHLPTGRDLFAVLQHWSEPQWLEFASPTRLLVGAQLDQDGPMGVFILDAVARSR